MKRQPIRLGWPLSMGKVRGQQGVFGGPGDRIGTSPYRRMMRLDRNYELQDLNRSGRPAGGVVYV